MTVITPHYLDVTAPDFAPNGPAVALARATYWRADTPVGTAVLRYEDVVALLRDRRFGQGSAIFLDIQGIGDGPLQRWWREMILNLEGPRHDRLRRLMVPAFRPPVVNDLRPGMRRHIDALIAEVLAGVEDDQMTCEVVATVADPYPIAVLSDLLGIEDAERPRVRRWATDLGLAFTFAAAANLERIETALVGLYDVADRLSEAELRNIVVTTLFAGHDTTKHQLAMALHTFVGEPESWTCSRSAPTSHRPRSRRSCGSPRPSRRSFGSPSRTSDTATSRSRPARS